MSDTRVMAPEAFNRVLRGHYAAHGRHSLPWRQKQKDGTYNAYAILVSEIMLQQTQVSRVVPKYKQFMHLFPLLESLARAPLSEVLIAWSGLGYNRRARYLHEAAKWLVALKEPWSLQDLVACKGIGHNTAAAVTVYAYNQPVVFVETNIRAVYIHHFFPNADGVTDQEIVSKLESTLDVRQPRTFYWALMDYGTHLKAHVGNIARHSRHYARQGIFKGSAREIRGLVLRELVEGQKSLEALNARIPDERLVGVVRKLTQEGLIEYEKSLYRLAR
jgi:A/G-specific adenine glycosylase